MFPLNKWSALKQLQKQAKQYAGKQTAAQDVFSKVDMSCSSLQSKIIKGAMDGDSLSFSAPTKFSTHIDGCRVQCKILRSSSVLLHLNRVNSSSQPCLISLSYERFHESISSISVTLSWKKNDEARKTHILLNVYQITRLQRRVWSVFVLMVASER